MSLGKLGAASLMSSLIPLVAISPILLYIGMLIGAQAFQETPKTHAPAIVLALVPHLAAWCTVQLDGALTAGFLYALSRIPAEAELPSAVPTAVSAE
jgi:adenine/guanine/hypoxanthine permease